MNGIRVSISIILLLLFPWRFVWPFGLSEIIFAALTVLILTLFFTSNRRIVPYEVFIPLLLWCISVVWYGHYNVILLFRLSYPFIAINVFRNLSLEKKHLFLIVGLSFIFLLFNYIPGLEFIVNPYKGRTSEGILGYQYLRASGLSVYPSDFAFLLLLIFPITSSRVIRILLIIGVYLSASRAGLFMLLFYLIFENWKRIFILVPFLVISASLFLSNEYLSITINTLLEGSVDGSIQHRLGEWFYVGEILSFRMDPLLSNYSSIGLPVIEGFYSYYLMNYGYLGLVLILVPLTFIVVSIVNDKYLSVKIKFFYVLMILVWFLASDILHHTKNIFFGYLILFSNKCSLLQINQKGE